MKTILALDTSTELASLALRRGGELIWEKEIPSQRSHSVALFPALQEAAREVARIDCIAVGLGPGSFAGIRIAIAAALGLQAAWECELVGMPSVLGLDSCSSSFVALGDARRGAWYFSKVTDGECVEGPCLLEDDQSLQEALQKAGLDLASKSRGSGAGSEPLPNAEAGLGLILTTDAAAIRWGAELRSPKARVLAELASINRGILQRDQLEPLYLREPYITVPKKTPLTPRSVH